MRNPKISDVEPGQVFAIEGTKSYPKLKLKKGYIDMRDAIHMPVPIADSEVEVLSFSEVMKTLKLDKKAFKDYIAHLVDVAGEAK
ncbi:MAG: hypothetical protein KAS32_04880 [Candidatus Peribacteraceae bacterium]|nr:hypothetical protein [Candidatus Peribacteraceae bacterium]